MMGAAESVSVQEGAVEDFLQARTIGYKTAVDKPASCEKIVEAFCDYLRDECKQFIEPKVARTALEKVVQYKKGFTVKKFGVRSKTTVNAFLRLIDGEATPITLKAAEVVMPAT